MADKPVEKNTNTVAVVLAAGSSSRMGKSKQLLKINDQSLIRRTINEVIHAAVDNIIVVLGFDHQVLQQEIAGLPIKIVINPAWKNGMGSSIKCGVRFANDRFPLCQSVLLAVCDQPLLTSNHLKKIITASQAEGKVIVASYYSGTPGVPALFKRPVFENLLSLSDQLGAKKIIQSHLQAVSLIDFPEGNVDLDTPEDWGKFIQAN